MLGFTCSHFVYDGDVANSTVAKLGFTCSPSSDSDDVENQTVAMVDQTVANSLTLMMLKTQL